MLSSYSGIAFPFRLTPDYSGGVRSSTTGPGVLDHIMEAVQILFGTSSVLQERWHLPDYGASPDQLHWAAMTDPVAGAYEAQIKSAFALYEDRVILRSVRILKQEEEGKLFIEIDAVERVTQQSIHGFVEV